MKVTVYFGSVRVIVPCGNGDLLVRDLMDLAITRYRKATGKSSSSIIRIHNLKSSRDEGILYPEDTLSDVADDREQIIAIFEEGYAPNSGRGDVTSTTSSVRTDSPDLLSVEAGSHSSMPYASNNITNGDVNEDCGTSTLSTLQVRRGSEPALNCLFPSSSDPNKRWSTAVVLNPTENDQSDINENGNDGDCASPVESLENNGDSKLSSLTFSRSSGRQSILNNSETYRWVEAADRQLLKDFDDNFHRKVPSMDSCEVEENSDISSLSDERERTVILSNESGPLGIHVVPGYDGNGRDTGLIIQGIEAGGRIDRDGRFTVGDRITEINGRSLVDVTFMRAQDMFRAALRGPHIQLEVVRQASSGGGGRAASAPKKPPPPVFPKGEEADLVEGQERAGGISTKVATVTPTKKVPASATRRIASSNTKKIGKLLTIDLTKGSSGLGFSLTTRDIPAGGNNPIYIKNILPKGAAIEDGRLLSGDRLLQVNGTPMNGKSQTEAVSILRNVPLGNPVKLVVSRQGEVEELENNVNAEPQDTESTALQSKFEDVVGIFPWKRREILTFQIPLTENQSAGLGVSVKGKSTSTESNPYDLGIFIKSVIPGGAAYKDGRLQSNDQLVNINGVSLLGTNNSSAMETLRSAMLQSDGPIRNAIILTIAREISEVKENGTNHPALLKPATNGLPEIPPPSSLNKPSSPANSTSSLNNPGLSGIAYNPSTKDNSSAYNPGLSGSNLNSMAYSSGLPGCNPVIERLTGQLPYASDGYGFTRNNVDLYGERALMVGKGNYVRINGPMERSYLLAKEENVIIEGEYETLENKKIGEVVNGVENAVALPAGSQLSLEESNEGFARDGFGRQSMSEKRHAQLDAKNTDTYQRMKKAKEERAKNRLSFEQDVHARTDLGLALQNSDPIGPSLGLRKSSSLESLQTMIQELNKDDEAARRAMKATGGSTRGSRSRGCNESFRAAVDRSYDAPDATVAMETLDEESESGSSIGHVLTRSSEHAPSRAASQPDSFHDELLSMYRNSKSTKKKGLLKGLGSVFKFGKNRKSSHDIKAHSDDGGLESDYSVQSSSFSPKDQEKRPESPPEEPARRQLPAIPFAEPGSRQERMRGLREQHQRAHLQRHGHYPLEQREEDIEVQLQRKEGNYAMMPYDIVHGRSHSLDTHTNDYAAHHNSSSKLPQANDTARFGHYMNYKEIQQHFRHRGEPIKVLPDANKPLPRLDSDAFHEGPTQSSQRHMGYSNSRLIPLQKSASEIGTGGSLPRTKAELSNNNVPFYSLNEPHVNEQTNNYVRKLNFNQQFFPSSKLYSSHMVPSSKV